MSERMHFLVARNFPIRGLIQKTGSQITCEENVELDCLNNNVFNIL